MSFDHNARRRAENRKQFKDSAYQDDKGVWRWKSNDRVPFADMLEDNDIDAEIRAKCEKAREHDNAIFFGIYRKTQAARTPDQIAEERAEARSAMGDGVDMINILTGEKFRT